MREGKNENAEHKTMHYQCNSNFAWNVFKIYVYLCIEKKGCDQERKDVTLISSGGWYDMWWLSWYVADFRNFDKRYVLLL